MTVQPLALDLPTFTNSGLIILGLLILALAAMLVPHPCPWRCPDCTARFPCLEQLLAHEARHRHPAYLLADLTREESAS